MARRLASLLVVAAGARAAIPSGDVVVQPPYTKDAALTDLGAPRGAAFAVSLTTAASRIFNGTDPTFSGTACDGPTPAECCHKCAPVQGRCPVNAQRSVRVYVPATYRDGDALPLLVMQDGPAYFDEVSFALDNLVGDAARPLPPFLVVSVENGGCDAIGSERGLEYDTLSARYAAFLETEVLPAVLADAAVRAAYPRLAITADPGLRAVFGCSSGAAAALTAAFFRNDLFQRVAAYSGTFVDQQDHADGTGAFAEHPQGAWGYHSGLRLLSSPQSPGAPRRLRVFHSASQFDLGFNLSATPVDDPAPAPNNTAGDPNAWTDGHHNWLVAGNRTAAALAAAGFPYRHVYAVAAHHCDGPMILATLADTLVWLWQGGAQGAGGPPEGARGNEPPS